MNYLTPEEIQSICEEVGETGNVGVDSNGQVWYQRENNSDRQYCGKVEDKDGARQIIEEFFNE